MLFCRLLIFLIGFFFKKTNISGISSQSNRFDLEQARRLVGPDLGLNCLQMLSANGTSRKGVNISLNLKGPEKHEDQSVS